jgi:hypothetical protein
LGNLSIGNIETQFGVSGTLGKAGAALHGTSDASGGKFYKAEDPQYSGGKIRGYSLLCPLSDRQLIDMARLEILLRKIP